MSEKELRQFCKRNGLTLQRRMTGCGDMLYCVWWDGPGEEVARGSIEELCEQFDYADAEDRQQRQEDEEDEKEAERRGLSLWDYLTVRNAEFCAQCDEDDRQFKARVAARQTKEVQS